MKFNALFAKFHRHKEDPNILYEDGEVIEYVHGFVMDANSPWTNVDFVLFPIHMSHPDHWFLLVFDIHRRRLVVYNSLQPTRTSMRTNISDACDAYIFLLPMILTISGFWKARTDINYSSEEYKQKGENDLIELEFAEGVPEQVEGDCGMFTICFAEYVLHKKFSQIPNPFPVAEYRNKLSVNLYVHALNKQVHGYVSDTENPGRFAEED